ncbi:MAG TPA: porin, partial [Burkholderiaceae bacterium]|nr:porin [Burkholderiaceae bacterium]
VSKVKRLDSGTYTASRLIFRGVEDLGDGLTAGFYLETRFNADVGAQQSATKFFNAGSQVYLADKKWGSLTLGRQYVPIFWSFLFADDTGPLRLHGYSALQSVQRSAFARISAAASPVKAAGSLDTISGGIYQLGITSAFEDNLVVYKTPVFGGATAMLAVGAAEGAGPGSGRVLGGNVEYRGGPFYGSVAFNQKRGTVPAGGSGAYQTQTEELVSALYEIMPNQLKVWGNFHPWKLQSPGGDLKGHDWMLGASYWFSQSELWVNYAAKTLDNCAACNSKGFGLGYHYFMSRRTELYASVAQVANDANSGNTLNGFAPGTLGKKVKGYAVGIAHTF